MPDDRSPFDSFLTPQSMLTPGAAGALAMMITNALGVNFDAPRAWTALLLSFVFGITAIVATHSVPLRALFYVLNSLIIFCVACGSNGALADRRTISAGLVDAALAQTPANTGGDEQSLERYRQLGEEYEALTKRIRDSTGNTDLSKDDLVKLIERRDRVEKEREALLDSYVKRAAGVSVEEIRKGAEIGGMNAEMKRPFFSRWKF